MKIWYKDLLCVLPDKMLTKQWHDCLKWLRTSVRKSFEKFNLVRRIECFNHSHFYCYCLMVHWEMLERELYVWKNDVDFVRDSVSDEERQISSRIEKDNSLFYGWHNTRYFIQCYYELQEMFDCGIITVEEWQRIYEYSMSLDNEKLEGMIKL